MYTVILFFVFFFCVCVRGVYTAVSRPSVRACVLAVVPDNRLDVFGHGGVFWP